MFRPFLMIACLCVLLTADGLRAEMIPVRHVQGDSFGFLVIRKLDGQTIAYGYVKQVVKHDLVVDDAQFRFKDGSSYEEITKFTQREVFRLVSDQVTQKGPSFKQDLESWIDVASGKITTRTTDKGKEKITNKHLDLPPDVSNGLLLTLAGNFNPAAAQTSLTWVAVSGPRVVTLNIMPAEEKTTKMGLLTFHTQHYIAKTKIKGAAGVIAPIIGKQPADIHVWIVKSEAPSFVEFEGQLAEGNPVWRIEMAAPDPDATKEEPK